MIGLQGSSTVASKERADICQEWVRMCAAANIPLSKTDHPAVQEFLMKRVVNGGSIPHSKQLQECYLEREYNARVEEIKDRLKDKHVSIITDEMSDDNCRFVLNVLAAPLEPSVDNKIKAYLLNTVYLEATNHTTVAQTVLQTVQDFGIKFENVRIINTDNASYMRKAFTTVFAAIFPNAVHITCLAHIMNLLGDSFKKPFKCVTKFVKSVNAMFFHANARKARFLRHMATTFQKKATMPPNPISTRWNCWYHAVAYHVEHFSAYKSFVQTEMDLSKSAAPDSIKELTDLLSDDRTSDLLLQKMEFIKEKSELFVTALDVFQSQQPLALKAWPMLEELHFRFEGGISLLECSKFFREDTNIADKMILQDLFNQAYALAGEKLEKYLTPEGQPGIDFLKSVQFFNSTKLVFFAGSDRVSGIRGLENVPEDELKKYVHLLGPNAVKQAVSSVDVQQFWASVTEDLPVLAALARPLISATVNSADAERSFSLYNLILSPKRRSLSPENMKRLCFLAYNQFVGPDF